MLSAIEYVIRGIIIMLQAVTYVIFRVRFEIVLRIVFRVRNRMSILVGLAVLVTPLELHVQALIITTVFHVPMASNYRLGSASR
jgi:hypothetical protein